MSHILEKNCLLLSGDEHLRNRSRKSNHWRKLLFLTVPDNASYITMLLKNYPLTQK